MLLSNLITPLEGASFYGQDRQITGLSADSRALGQGFVFVAIPGTKMDGSHFIEKAIQAGAVAIVTESPAPQAVSAQSSVTYVHVPSARAALSIMASRYYPRQPQKIAAVTGTSGKTSTVQFTRQLWSLAGNKAASIGTLGLITPETNQYGSLTTPDPVSLHQMIDDITGKGITHLAMEASSHGIELHRLDAVQVDVAAFTNFSRDHLDYHETMESYFAAKLRLFEFLLKKSGTAVLNADVPEFETLAEICKSRGIRVFSYGRAGADIRLGSFSPQAKGQALAFEAFGKTYAINLPVIGSFQVENSLCALALAVASGESPDETIENMAHLSGVPGRLEYIGTSAKGGAVFVDYAHKPSALENVLSALRPHVEASGSQLHVIIGCGGDRDKGKRPLMGEIAQRLANKVIITDDNPRTESASTIRKDILAGCTLGPNLREIGDRATAIAEGIQALGQGDVLVIAGKGHEDGQIVGSDVLPFNDATEAQKNLRIK